MPGIMAATSSCGETPGSMVQASLGSLGGGGGRGLEGGEICS